MQEEADTKMFLCASYAATLCIDKVNIVTVDSDVAILSWYYQQEISTRILLEYGTSTKTKIFDINANSLREELVKVLPSLHAFTWCDSTSSMCGIGKVKCYRMIEEDVVQSLKARNWLYPEKKYAQANFGTVRSAKVSPTKYQNSSPPLLGEFFL